MPYFVKCAQCGSTYDKDNYSQCPYCENNKLSIESNFGFSLGFVDIFESFYKKFSSNGKITLSKILLISIAEIAIGIIAFLVGWLLIIATGTSRGPTISFIIGASVIVHSLYSIVKYGILNILNKNKPNISEIKARLIVWVSVLSLGTLFFFMSFFIERNNLGSEDLVGVLVFLGIGLLIGGITSITIWFYKRIKSNWSYKKNSKRKKSSFVFDSDMFQLVKSDNKVTSSYNPRRIEVEHLLGNNYWVQIKNREKEQAIIEPIMMNIVSCSIEDDCVSYEDKKGNFGLNVFYEDGEVTKCVFVLKQKNELIQYYPPKKININDFVTSFVFESNMQQRIDLDNNVTSAHCPRRIEVEHIEGEFYNVSIINLENKQPIINTVEMHPVSYWSTYECVQLVTDDNQRKLGLKVYYKDGQVHKCIIELNSKNVFINYYKE